MNELSIGAKFLFAVACAAAACHSVGSLGHVTYKMAEAAVAAHQQDQMSYGAFSRQLWSSNPKLRHGLSR
jgi:hypothetical protein